MRSETISVGPITAVVRSRSRRTAILEAEYKQALREQYPSIADFEMAQLSIPMPSFPIDSTGALTRPLTTAEQQAMEVYAAHTGRARVQHELGAVYAEGMGTCVPLLARLVTVGGASFHVGDNGQLASTEVVKAFEDWLNDEGDKDSFWSVLAAMVARLDAPLTTVEQKPPDALTEAEKDDPLSVVPELVGSSS